MAIARRFAGLGIVLLSGIGLVVCIAVIVGAWVGKTRFDLVVAAVFGTADEALCAVELQLDRARQALEKSQQRVGGLSSIAERLKTAEAVSSKEFEPIMQSFDDILDDLRLADSRLESSRAIAKTVSKLAASLVSSEYAAARPDSTGVAVAEGIQELSDSAVEAVAKLQAIRQELIQVRDRGTIARDVVVGLLTRVADLEGRLTNLSGRLARLNEQVAKTRASCTALSERVLWWAKASAVTMSIVALWFGVSQVKMIIYGWRLV
jgi:chromosome segregation ATPase